ncbi:uncharacterized protein LOC119730751 isoform X2 [Patiria miniata]|uniref:TLDc domain-containing protein n=1 Tax=Patiria miniata TaxID=46514 RepID=A0A914A8G7_PATMI|nr:uncharacterized protein LOC119730751 isoform X2 [Patiria miniata]
MGAKESHQRHEAGKGSRENNSQLNHFFAVVSHSDRVSRDDFINYFPEVGRPLAGRLFTRISPSDSECTKLKCTEPLSQILSVATTSAQNSLYIAVFSGISLKLQDVTNLLETALMFFLNNAGVPARRSGADDTAIQALAKVLTSKGMVTTAAEWMDAICPELFTEMHRCLVGWLRGEEKPSDVSGVEDEFSGRLLCRAWWWILQSSLSSVFTKKSKARSAQQSEEAAEESALDSVWDLLYSSSDHGLSTNRLQHHVFGYRGPTLMILSCDQGDVYAVAVDTEWREGTQSWGGSSCCVMRLMPDLQKLEEGENMIFFNDRSRNMPRGISIGRNPKKKILTFKEGMEVVEHNHRSESVRTLEIWGCGDSGTRTAQAKLKKMEMKDAERAAKVKLPGQWEDSPDRMLLEMGGVKVNHAEQFTRD